MSLTFETRVAAAVAEQSPKLMRQEFSRVLLIPANAGGRQRHRLGFRDVLYFKLKASLEEAGVILKPEDRRALYQVLQRKQQQVGPWRRVGRRLERLGDVPVIFDLSKITIGTHERLRNYRQGHALIESRPEVCGGEPVFKGTRVPVVQVVEQFRRGVSVTEIAEDYPNIDEKGLRYAALHARIGNEPGRPMKALRLRRVAGEAADR